MNNVFPESGFCKTKDRILMTKIMQCRESFRHSSEKSIGIAWNHRYWWYVRDISSKPKISEQELRKIINQIDFETKEVLKCLNLKKKLKI